MESEYLNINNPFEINLEKSLEIEKFQNDEPLSFEEIQQMKKNVVGRMFSKLMLSLQVNLQINQHSYMNIFKDVELNGYIGLFQEIQAYLIDIASDQSKPPMNQEKLKQLICRIELFNYKKKEVSSGIIEMSIKPIINIDDFSINVKNDKLNESEIIRLLFEKGSFHLLYKNTEATIRYKFFEQDLILFLEAIINNHYVVH